MILQPPEFDKSTPKSRLQALSKLSRDIGFKGLGDFIQDVTYVKQGKNIRRLAWLIVNDESLYNRASKIIEDSIEYRNSCEQKGELWRKKQVHNLNVAAETSDTSQIHKTHYKIQSGVDVKRLESIHTEYHDADKEHLERSTHTGKIEPKHQKLNKTIDDTPRFNSKEAEKLGEKSLAEIERVIDDDGNGNYKFSLKHLNSSLKNMGVKEEIKNDGKISELVQAANTLRTAITDWKHTHEQEGNGLKHNKVHAVIQTKGY